MLSLKRTQLFILNFAFCFILVCSNGLTAQNKPEFKAVSPEKVPIGQAIPIEINSKDPISKLKLNWLDQKVSLKLDKAEDKKNLLLYLGTDVKKHKPGTYKLNLSVCSKGSCIKTLKRISIIDKNFPEQRLKVSSSKVHLSKEDLSRHRKEKKKVLQALNQITSEKYWSHPFIRPAKGEISSAYGLKRFFNNQPRSPHRGIDLRTGMAAPVKACNHGRVILVGKHFFAGNSVYIDHGQGIVSMYFHLCKVLVSEGEVVIKGQVIAKTGQTGRATGPHLHFGLSVFGNLIDPLPLIKNTASN